MTTTYGAVCAKRRTHKAVTQRDGAPMVLGCSAPDGYRTNRTSTHTGRRPALTSFTGFPERGLLPDYNRGRLRRRNTEYQAVDHAIAKAKRHGDRAAVKTLRRQRRTLPSQDPNDPDYRRLRYVRYCDDWLLGFAGPRHEAEQIKSRIATFLREDLKLELSPSKTLITHATSQAARFLGYEIKTQRANNKLDRRGQRSVNAAIGLFVPRDVIRQKCANYMRNGNPAQRGPLLHDQDFTVVAKYQAEYRGLVQYYLLAQDVFRLDTLRWVMETSMLKTLAGKHKSTVTKMARRYKTVIETPDGKRTCFQVTVERDRGRKPLVARFGGDPAQTPTHRSPVRHLGPSLSRTPGTGWSVASRS